MSLGTDTVKRGVSPTASLSSDATTKNQSFDTTKQTTGNRDIPPKPYARSSSQFAGNNEGSHQDTNNGRVKESRSNGRGTNGNGNGGSSYAITSIDPVLAYNKNGLQAGSGPSSHSSPSSSTSPSSIHSFKENLRISSTTSGAAAATSPSSISSSSTAAGTTETGNGGKYGTGYSQKMLSEMAVSDRDQQPATTSSINFYGNSGKIKSSLDDSLSQSFTPPTTTNSGNNISSSLRNSKISSPSKTILDSNSTLSYSSLTLGRVSNNGSNLYTSTLNQSDNGSNGNKNTNKYDFKSSTTNELLQKTNTTTSYTSSGTGISSYSPFASSTSYGNSIVSSSSPYTTSSSVSQSFTSSLGIYGTLPKTANSFVFSTPDYQISYSPNASGTQSSVKPTKAPQPPARPPRQTNPFLNPFLNPPSDDSNGDQTNNVHSSSSQSSGGAHQIDEDDLK